MIPATTSTPSAANGRARFLALVLFAGLLLMQAIVALPAVELAGIFTDHVVLQRGVPVPVWGRADPGEQIMVSIDQQAKTTTADAAGAWTLRLDALQTAAPRTLSVTGRSTTLTISDVLVGEVWLGSGQSNMALEVRVFAKDDPVLAEVTQQDHPHVRLFSSTGWHAADAEHQTKFSAQLLYFGISLQRELGIPVGLICRAVSGSPSVPWLSEQAFQADAAIQEEIRQYSKAHPNADAEATAKYSTDLAAWEKARQAAGNTPRPAPPKLVAGDDKRGIHFEKMIRPLIPFAIRGVLWDQGESGTGMAGVANNALVTTALIRSWRADWGQGDFPFLYVQKGAAGCALHPEDPLNRNAAAFQPLPAEPPPSARSPKGPDLTDVPGTIMIPTTDLDHTGGGHPPTKSAYGARGCSVALRTVYGQPGESAGPTYASCSVVGGSLRIAFTHVGQGLTCPMGQRVQGFAVAGTDAKFAWAEATIDGSTVVLRCPSIPNPVMAQYWAAPWANLFNRDGLPATRFRCSVP